MILLTGGLGFIGSHTAVELIQSGYEIVIVDNLSNSTLNVLDGIEKITKTRPIFHNLDLRNKKDVNDLFNIYDFKGCIHFAAFKSVNESIDKPLEYYENNLNSLNYLLQNFKKHNLENFIFSSSCTVYGKPEFLPIKEDSPVQPNTPYGNTKKIGEEILQDSNIKSISLRYFNPIGAHPSGIIGEVPTGIPSNLLPYLTQTAKGLRDELMIFGNDYPTHDGTAIRDYIHVVDLAKSHVIALDRINNNEENYEVFNIGTGIGYSVLDIKNTFERVNNLKLNWKFYPSRDGDISEIYSDTSKSENVLGFKCEYSLEDALRHSWNWEKK